MNKTISITATLDKIIFYNKENSYAILCFKAEEKQYKDTFTAIGQIYNPQLESTYLLTGEWTAHPKYGKQFSVKSALIKTPKNIKGIRNYLAKGNIKGLGPKLADKIINHFGEELIDIIENNDITRFKEVPGIGKKKVEEIVKVWQKQVELRETMISQKLYNKYQGNAVKKVLENPYKLIDDIYGIGFKKADDIAFSIDIKANSSFRIEAGINYILKEAAQNEGHLYLPLNELTVKTQNTLYKSEKYKPELSKIIEKIEKKFKIKYDEPQINAIQVAVNNNIMVLTGGPGTGKTTVIKGIIEALEKQKFRIYIIVDLAKQFKEQNIECQILSPMKNRNSIGTLEINQRIQQVLNPTEKELKYGNNTYRINDKIMQLKNNYDKMVFNGDIGYISEVDKTNNQIKVKFEDKAKPVTYKGNQMNQITLSYASTIHKSQGSEYPVVIIPYTKSFYIMLQKNLLYTGITRAKQKLILIGQKEAIRISIGHTPLLNRNTKLDKRIQEYQKRN